MTEWPSVVLPLCDDHLRQQDAGSAVTTTLGTRTSCIMGCGNRTKTGLPVLLITTRDGFAAEKIPAIPREPAPNAKVRHLQTPDQRTHGYRAYDQIREFLFSNCTPQRVCDTCFELFLRCPPKERVPKGPVPQACYRCGGAFGVDDAETWVLVMVLRPGRRT